MAEPDPHGPEGTQEALRLLRRLLPADDAVRRRAWDEVLGILKRRESNR